MGGLTRVFKGIGKVFKKIGRGIKKGFKKFGKFMNKIGIVGQIAMMFILPAIGGLLMKGLSALATSLGASGSAILQGAGSVLRGALNFAKEAGHIYRTVTDGVMDFGKTQLNKIPNVNIDLSGSGTWLENAKVNMKGIGDAFRKTLEGQGGTLAEMAQRTSYTAKDLGTFNPELVKGIPVEDWGNIIVGKGTPISTVPLKVSEAIPSVVGAGGGATTTTTIPSGTEAVPPAVGGEYHGQQFPAEATSAVGAVPAEATAVDGGVEEFFGAAFEEQKAAGTRSLLDTEGKRLLSFDEVAEGFLKAKKVTEAKGVWQKRLEGMYQGLAEPEPKGFYDYAKDFYGEAKQAIKERYALTGTDSPGAIPAALNIYSDIAQFVPGEEPPKPSPGLGPIIELEPFRPEQFAAANTVMVPALQQMQRDSGIFGYSAYLDSQISYGQRMIQENQKRFRGVA
jgi:hypothetical protein